MARMGKMLEIIRSTESDKKIKGECQDIILIYETINVNI